MCYVFQFSTCGTPGISSQPHLEAELCIYFILVGWRRLTTALKSTTTRAPFSFSRPIWLAVELDHLCGMENLTSTHGECFVSRIIVVHMVRHPRGSYTVYPLLSLKVATPEINCTLSSLCKKFRLTRDSWQDSARPSRDSPNTSRRSRLGQAFSVLSVKTQRAASRHFRGARVYGHTTTAKHDVHRHHPPRWKLTASFSVGVVYLRGAFAGVGDALAGPNGTHASP